MERIVHVIEVNFCSKICFGWACKEVTDYVDEFAIRTLMMYEEKSFVNICAQDADFTTEEEKEELRTQNESNKDMFEFMKNALGEAVKEVRFTNKLKNHSVCLSNEGMLSSEMEKVLNAMPGNNGVKAELVLEINSSLPLAQKLVKLFDEDKDTLTKYAKLLYNQARLIGGMSIENPTEFSNLICELM